MYKDNDGKEVFEKGDKVIGSTWDIFVEQPDVKGIFSHYDPVDNKPHLYSKNAVEISAYGPTRKFDQVRADKTMFVNAKQIKHLIEQIEANGVDLETVNIQLAIRIPGHRIEMIDGAQVFAQYASYGVRDEGVILKLEN